MKMKRNPEVSLVLQAAEESHRLLADKGLCHVIIGGLAVYLHGDIQRKPRDVDLLIRPEDVDPARQPLLSGQYAWHNHRKACISRMGVRVEPHWKGKKGGKRGRKKVLHLPCPTTVEVAHIDGLPVIGLLSLIETKLECELQDSDDPESDSKHRKDVLKLIRIKNLQEPFANSLSRSKQDLFGELVKRSQQATQ